MIRRLSLAPLSWPIVAAACGAPPPPPPPPAPTPEPAAICALAEPASPAADTVRIALTEALESARAPVPRNDAEALVFRHLYEALVRVDCEGVARPALATAWREADEGRAWTFTLRPDATFWDGAPLDADALLAGWRGTDSATLVEDVRADRRSVTVFLRDARDLDFFAAPSLRVVKRIPESDWPVGTGPWWVRGSGDAGNAMVALPVGRRADARPLAFRVQPGADPRDLVDAGATLIVTRDPRGPAYVAGRDDWVALPLPWSRTYGLTSPVLSGSGSSLDAAFVESLARDVVPGDARPAGAPDSLVCGAERPIPGRDPRPRLVYRRDDPVARALAERLVARADVELAFLFGPARTRGTVAAGLPDAEFDAARARGDDLGYVVGVPGAVPPRCSAPLIQTRAYALVRDRAVRVVRDWDGPRLEPVPRSP